MFGYFEARCKFQTQCGHWPAFWLFPAKGIPDAANTGRDGTEIDIMEKAWLTDKIEHTLHWDGYGQNHKSEGKVIEQAGLSKGFHTFGLWWKPDEYIFYVDGVETWRTAAGGVCQTPAYVKLTEEIGKWAGDIAKAELPDFFLTDYVRIYELAESQKR